MQIWNCITEEDRDLLDEAWRERRLEDAEENERTLDAPDD